MISSGADKQKGGAAGTGLRAPAQGARAAMAPGPSRQPKALCASLPFNGSSGSRRDSTGSASSFPTVYPAGFRTQGEEGCSPPADPLLGVSEKKPPSLPDSPASLTAAQAQGRKQ